MGSFKDKLFHFPTWRKSKKEGKDQIIIFVVPDRESLTAASKALSKVRIPETPQLRTLGNAYTFGQDLVRKFRREKIKIVEHQGLSREEAYRANEKTLTHLVEERNAIADIIEKMIHPVIKVVAGVTVQIDDLYRGVFNHEERIREIERMMRDAFGKAPEIPNLPNGKKPYGGTMQDAADEVLKLFAEDRTLPPSERRWKSETQACEEFFKTHQLLQYPEASAENLYWNLAKVKKTRMEKP